MCACSPAAAPRLETGALIVEADEDRGALHVREKDGPAAIIGLHAAAEVEEGGELRRITTLPSALSCRRAGERELVCQGTLGSQLAVEWDIRFEPDRPRQLRLATEFRAPSQPVRLRRVWPLRVAAGDDGAVVLGRDPAKARILMNGSDELVDFFVDLAPGDRPLSDPASNLLLADYSSYSNGSALALDLESGIAHLVGFLDFDWAVPLVAFGTDAQTARPIEDRIPFTDLSAEARFPWTVELPAEARLMGGTALLIFGENSPFDALEAYGDALGEFHRVALPAAPLSGWDSWYTTTPPRTDLDAAYLLDAAARLEEAFGEFGLSSMQLDEGWQDTWGDWNVRAGFPDGIEPVAAGIQEHGLVPELWLAPFCAREESRLFREHPEWFLPKGLYGQVLMPADMHALDPARAEVRAYAEMLAERVRGWEFGSLKLDFAYYMLLSEFTPHFERTPVRLYRQALRAFRERLGSDIHFINISQAVPNYGLCQGFRIGLDTWPCWEGGEDCARKGYPGGGGISAQGIKPGVRMAARRYWLNGRVWFNHQDQVFFRDVTLAEATAFLSAAALSGGMVSLGEDAANLTPEQVDRYRRILPLTGLTARPLDLFAREFPEVWHLPLPGGAVLGLFHWGQNRDLSQNPYRDMPDGAERAHPIDLGALGFAGPVLAYEFWSDEFLGELSGVVELALPPHSARVLRLRPRPDHPAILGTNRHILMGPGVLDGESWDGARRTLHARVHTTRGFSQTIDVWLPSGFSPATATLAGHPSLAQERPRPEVLRLRFPGADPGWHDLSVTFD
ncbi:MAG: hypothetical protein GYA21_15495 [Myxococcales bacterium]|nr:hypothetical protein [Myxococcales bacterium]